MIIIYVFIINIKKKNISFKNKGDWKVHSFQVGNKQ